MTHLALLERHRPAIAFGPSDATPAVHPVAYPAIWNVATRENERYYHYHELKTWLTRMLLLTLIRREVLSLAYCFNSSRLVPNVDDLSPSNASPFEMGHLARSHFAGSEMTQLTFSYIRVYFPTTESA